MMLRKFGFAVLTFFFVLAFGVEPIVAQENGFRSIFDGQTLTGWTGDSEFWSVTDGAIVGQSTDEKPLKHNSFLTWDGGDVFDFELRLKYRLTGSPKANSGVQIRSRQTADGEMVGYQADIDRSGDFFGGWYDEKTERKLLCQRGKKVTIDSSGKRTTETLGDAKTLFEDVSVDGWNDYSIKAVGNELTISVNGKVMSQLIDSQSQHADSRGLIGLQLHSGPASKIEFKDILIKRLPLKTGQKKIVFVAGKPSHGWGSHEHNAGCLLLAQALETAATKTELPIVTTVYKNGWPSDPTAFDHADTVVVYCDGGVRHFLHEHGDAFEDIMRRGAGLVCLHYGVEVPKGVTGQRFLNWIGGYFETHWSVNPHWLAKFESLPKHPVTQGVKPFEMQDEWYYHMRFSPQFTRVTPVLSALPPKSTLKRKDGPHSGNPAVRKAVLEEKKAQHVAWAFERGDGKGRGFGFTGGHFHKNWQNDDFRKLVLNAIVWTAHADVPTNGIESATPTEADLDANQDYPKPEPKK